MNRIIHLWQFCGNPILLVHWYNDVLRVWTHICDMCPISSYGLRQKVSFQYNFAEITLNQMIKYTFEIWERSNCQTNSFSFRFRASSDEMREKANNLSQSPSAILVNNEELPKSTDPPTYTRTPQLANMYVPPPKPINSMQGPVY